MENKKLKLAEAMAGITVMSADDAFNRGEITAKNANMTLDSALAMADIFDERPSLSHPAKADRVEAIKAGWNEPETAKDCN